MTDTTEPGVPAGWYPDPWGSTSARWWNGTAWTETLREPDAPAQPVEASQPAEPLQPAEPVQPAAYEPAVTRSTYESTSLAATQLELPSRRALRGHPAGTSDEQPAAAAGAQPEPLPDPQPAATVVQATPLPPLTQVPQFTPEPIASVLPPPVFTDPDPVSEAAAPSATPAPAAAPVSASPFSAAPASAAPLATTGSPYAPTAPDDGWAASLSTWDSIEPSSTPPDAKPIFGDVPPVSYAQRSTSYQPLHGRTSPVWLIVIMPIVQAVATVGSLFLFPGIMRFDSSVASLVPATTDLAALQDWVAFAAAPLSLAFFLFTLIMGFQDRARLRLLGHERTASPWWIVLHPLVYLIVRSARVRAGTGRRGSGPLTTYLCLYVAPPLALVVTTAVVSALDGALPG